MFTNGPGGRGSIQGRVIPKIQKVAPLCLTFSIIRYGLRISGTIQGKEWRATLHLAVVAIEKRVFKSTSTTVGQLIYMYVRVCDRETEKERGVEIERV